MPVEQRPSNWRSNLRGRVDEYVVRVLDKVQSSLTDLQGQIDSLKKNLSVGMDLKAIRNSLESGGATPLNVEGLLGLLGTPQTGGAPTRTAAPDLSDPLTKDGALYVLQGAPNILYRVNGSHTPATFDSIGGSGSVVSVATNSSLSGGPITTSGTLALVIGSNTRIQKSDGTKLVNSSITDSGSLIVIDSLALPVADPGVSGALWNNAGVMNISP